MEEAAGKKNGKKLNIWGSKGKANHDAGGWDCADDWVALKPRGLRAVGYHTDSILVLPFCHASIHAPVPQSLTHAAIHAPMLHSCSIPAPTNAPLPAPTCCSCSLQTLCSPATMPTTSSCASSSSSAAGSTRGMMCRGMKRCVIQGGEKGRGGAKCDQVCEPLEERGAECEHVRLGGQGGRCIGVEEVHGYAKCQGRWPAT